MSISSSGFFTSTFVATLGASQIGLDLDDDDMFKVALFTDSVVPDFDAVAASAAYGAGAWASNEVSGTGYTAGGAVLASAALTGASGVLKFDAADSSWTSSTITGAKGALIYADGLTGKNAVVLVTLGSAYSTSNGTLAITWNSGGIFTVTLNS